VLSYGDGDCKVTLRNIWSNRLICHNNIEANDRVLGRLGPLKHHVHINVIYDVKLFLRGLDII